MATSALLNRRVLTTSASMRSLPSRPAQALFAGRVAPRTVPYRCIIASATAGSGGPTSGPSEPVGGKPTGKEVPDIVIVTTGGGTGAGGKGGATGGGGGRDEGFRVPEVPPPGGTSWSQVLRWLMYIAAGAALLQFVRRYGPFAKDKTVEQGRELGREAKDLGSQAAGAIKSKARDAKDAGAEVVETVKAKGRDVKEGAKEAKDAAGGAVAKGAEKVKETAVKGTEKVKDAGHFVAEKLEDEFHKGEEGVHEQKVFDGIKGAAGAVGRVLHIGGEKAGEAADKAKSKVQEAFEDEEENTDRKKVYYAVGGTALAITAVGVGSYLWNSKPWAKGDNNGKPAGTKGREPAGSAAARTAKEATENVKNRLGEA